VKKILIVMFLAACSELPNENYQSELCSINSENYEFTEFNCGGGDYRQRIVCGDVVYECGRADYSGLSRAGCTTANLIEEYQMGHCTARNYCDWGE
jgi:hypothetical protein